MQSRIRSIRQKTHAAHPRRAAARLHTTMQPHATRQGLRNKPTAQEKRQLEKQIHAVPTVSKDREFQCDECGSRCTETDEGTELGHKYGCPQRPEGLPAGGAGGGAYHDGGDA